jgi:PAS domain-containing protein
MIEFPYYNPDTKEISWLRSLGKAYFDENGNCVRFAGTTQDITAKIYLIQETISKNCLP